MNRFSLNRSFGRCAAALAKHCTLAIAVTCFLACASVQGQTTESASDTTKATSNAAALSENGAFAQRQDSGNEERSRSRSRGPFGRDSGNSGGGGGSRFSFGRGSSGGSGGIGGTVNKDLPPERQPVAATGDGKLRFNSRNQPWGDVIAWFAEQAGWSLVGDVHLPEGGFNYQSSKDEALTVTEALDKLNYVLHTKDRTLIRRDDTLMLVDLRNELPPGFVPTVDIESLDNVGNFEFVNVLFKLSNMSLEEAQSEIANVRGPHGSVKLLPKTRQLSVTDTAGRLKAIKQVIDMVENPDANATENLRSLPVHTVKAEDAMNLVKQLLNIPADRSNTADGSLRIVADPLGRRLLVSGKPDAIQRVEDIVATLDGNVQHGAALVRSPQLEIYPLTGVDPTSVHQVLQTLLAADAATVRLSIDAQGRLIAYAPPEVHSTIQSTIRQMQQDGRQIDVMRLMTVDPQQAMIAINKLFTGPDGTVKSGLNVQAVPETGTLMVYATRPEIDQIRGMLAQMGETDLASDRLAGRDEKFRIVPLTGRNARSAISQIEQLWPMIHKSKIRRITPSAMQPTADEGAYRGTSTPFDSGIVERRPSETAPVEASIQNSTEPDSQPRTEPSARPSSRATERTAREPGIAPTSTPKKVQPEVNQEASADRSLDLELGELLAPAEQEHRVPVVLVNQSTGDEAKSETAPEDKTDGPSTQRERLVPFPGASESEPGDNTEETSEAPSADNGAAQVRIGDGSPIFVAPGPGGVMIASEDQKALDDFEALLKTLATRAGRGQEYTVFYLKHAKAQTIGPLVSSILTSNSSAGLAASAANPFGNFGGRGRGGIASALGNVTQLTTSSSTPPSIIADSRLNALFVQANASDLDSIEQLLQVLDQPESPEDVSIVPKPRMISVRYKSAEQIANVVKEVYSNRLIGGGGSRGGAGGGGRDQGGDQRERFLAALRGDNGGGGGGRGGRGGGGFGGRGGRTEQEELTQMTVGVDVASNSIVVSAPDLLFQEVKQLVDELDTATSDANNDTMRVVTLRQSNPAAVQQALQQLVGDQVQTSGVRNSRSNSSRGNSSRTSGRGSSSGGSEAFRSFGGGGFGGFGGGGFGGGGFGGGGFGGGGGNRGGFNGGGGGRGGFGGGGGGRGGRGGD